MFQDDGKAFAKALTKRKARFVALLKVSVSVPREDFVVGAFSTKMNALYCTVDTRKIELEDFQELDVVTKDLGLKIVIEIGRGVLYIRGRHFLIGKPSNRNS